MLVYCFNDDLEIWSEGSSTDEEAINIFLFNELPAVLGIHRASVENSRGCGNFGRHFLGEPVSNVGVRLLSLLGSRDFAGADGPHGLVSNHDVAPLVLLQLVRDGLQLPGINPVSLAHFSLLEALADASHDRHSIFNRHLGLDGHILVCRSIFGSSLGVAGQRPVDADVFEHVSGDISGKSSGRPA